MKYFLNCVIKMFLVGAIILPLNAITADVGPKPSMDFYFIQEFSGQSITITNGILFECDDPDCNEAKPLEELGPQRFSCEETSCYAMAYGFRKYHQLDIQFSDGITRLSNVFTKLQFQATYKVTIRQTDLLVSPKFSLDFFSPLTYLVLCGIGLIGLVAIIIIVIFIIRRKKK
jgi:hypothetical protein